MRRPLHVALFAPLAALLVALLFTRAGAVSAAEAECRVLDPELAGRYEGGCLDGLAHGEGVANGTAAEYRGAFRAGRKHGSGVKTWLVTGDSYEGTFDDDRRHGRGTYRWGPRSPWAGESYAGEYRADRRHGTGTYTWSSGDTYTGPWTDDVQTGPRTPMQHQRTRAAKALLAVIGTPGARVCGVAPLGIAHHQRIEGVVAEVLQDRLLIRVARIDDRPAAREDVLFWDVAMNWRPCR